MKRGRPRKDGLDDLLPGRHFVRETIRALRVRKKRGRPAQGPTITDRDIDFIARYSAGETLQQIGSRYGISRERVRQRLKIMGLNKLCGGQSVKSFLAAGDKMAARQAWLRRRAARIFKSWGLSLDQYETIRAEHKRAPFTVYEQQRNSARQRGIGWELTFAAWWGLWVESGKWAERGLGKGRYCMARWADDGPYSAANAHICTNEENGREYQVMKKLRPPKNEHVGVYLMYPGLKNAYLAKLGKRYIGHYATADEAIAAREQALTAREAA